MADMHIAKLVDPIKPEGRDGLASYTHVARLKEEDGATAVLPLTWDPTGDEDALRFARLSLDEAIKKLRTESVDARQ